ncbi:MAG: ABC transporter substrate-binding protein [Clostridia bacterium]|nr:ABC transporter substrate-binding protein [Clostridia bacterium]
MKKLLSLILALLLLVALPLLSACNKDETPDNGDQTPTPPALDTNLEIRVWTLNGTTGFGMAPLINSDKEGTAALNYTFTVETAATNVRDALINGTADIGALPTNLASALYNSTNGEIVLLALNTRGVLYLVSKTAVAPTSLADLSGKTVYVPAQNPTFITKALIDKAQVANVTLDNTTYAEPAALQAAVAQGLVDYAVLPEPMVTIAKSSAAEGVSLTVALDLTAEWNKHFTEGSLVQGCVVARKAFVEAHPAEVAKFLEEYEDSLTYVVEHPEEASAMIVDAGIFAKAPVAKVAIPKCNLCFVTGEAMKTAMAEFLAAMPAASIGGKLPGDSFYYVSN